MQSKTAALVAGALLALAAPARAQDVTCDNTSSFPCSFQLRDLKLQKVPAVFKFQARVSQAKLPIGEGLFTTVYVKLLRGSQVLCQEQFANVKVVDSVLNLEIGRNMTCELDEVMAENSDLAFQICPGGTENCLKPVSLGSAPYAIKASFASIAQQAHEANIAGQANYAHRVTADRDLLIRNTLGTGYFDFETPTAEKALELYPNPANYSFADSGFLVWTPIRDRNALDLHIAGKRQDGDRLTELRSLHLVSEDTTATGDFTITPSPGGKGLTVAARGAHVTGNSDIAGTLSITQGTTVQSGGIHVTDDSNVNGALTVSRATTVQAGGVHVTGASDVNGTLLVSQAETVQGTLLVNQAATVAAGGAHVTGDSDVDGQLDVSGTVRVAAGGLIVDAGGFDVNGDSEVVGKLTAHDIQVDGSLFVLDGAGQSQRAFAIQGSKLAINPDRSLLQTEIRGTVHFTDLAIFDGGVTDPHALETFVLADGETRDLTLGGDLAVVGTVSIPNGITGGLLVSGGATIHGASAFPDGITGGLAIAGATAVAGNLSTTGTFGAGGLATFTGGIAVPGGVTGALSVSGAITSSAGLTAAGLTISGASTFNGGVTLAGGVDGVTSFRSNIGVTGNGTFSGTLGVSGTTTLAHLNVGSGLNVSGATSFADAVSFPGGVTGNVNLSNSLAVTGTTTLSGNTNVGGNLTIDGTTRFNGPVNFGGSFVGTTQFQNASVSGNLTVGGLSIFSGAVSFPGGITGSTTLDTLTVNTALISKGATTFEGPVDFQGSITGLPTFTEYVKASGETRGLTLPSLVVTGGTTLQGSLAVTGSFGHVKADDVDIENNATVHGNSAVEGNEDVNGDLQVSGKFSAECRICLNYADNHGDNAADRKHVCVKMSDGSNSGTLNLSGDVDGNDVMSLTFLCDGGGNETGPGWK